MEIREKVFPRKHRDKCRQKRFRSMCSVKKRSVKFTLRFVLRFARMESLEQMQKMIQGSAKK